LSPHSESAPNHAGSEFEVPCAERTADVSRVGHNKQAVAFFTHLFDPTIEFRYRKLKQDLGGLAQIFIMAPLGTSIPDRYLDEAYFFDYDRLRSGAVRVIGDKLIPGNVHLVQLDFWRHRPGFDYYWFIEFDVVFTGNWTTLLTAVDNDRSDLMGAHVRSQAEEPRWPWWDTLVLPGWDAPRSDWLRAFFPVYRISANGLRAVEEHVKQGWSGHFEALLPCAMRSASLSISELGGSGRWTPKNRRFRFYSSYSSDFGKSLNAGTHRHRPPHSLPLLRRNAIFHPVKADASDRKAGVVQFLKRQYLGELGIRCSVSLYYNIRYLGSVLSRRRRRDPEHLV
jgi:hypothetical protein